MSLLAISLDQFLLYGAILAIVGLYFSKAGFKFGIPSLLLFLGVGMLANYTGFVEFNDPISAQVIGSVALVIILFSGGMDTSFKEIKPIIVPGALLATVGVLLTAFITGTFIYYLFRWHGGAIEFSFLHALLFASVMSSTDSASVFSILRSRKMNLKYNLKPLLEFESGSNDPMAYMLTIILIQMIQAEGSATFWDGAWLFLVQFSIGVAAGLLLGKVAVWVVNKINLYATGLYSILMVMLGIFIYAFTNTIGGNGYLAVYLAGLVIGNSPLEHKKSISLFFDGFQWLAQLIMFLTLGLLVDVDLLIKLALPAFLVAVFLIVLGRPLAVHITLLPFMRKINYKAQAYVCWVGLRGAVPIIFAMSPWVAGIEGAEVIFTLVFFITLVSLLVQGSSVSWMAEKFGLVDHTVKEQVFQGVDLPNQIKSTLSEMIVSESMIAKSNRLMDIKIPEHMLAILVQRDGQYFIPRGSTELKVDDHILIISDDEDALIQAYEELGIQTYSEI